jgi:ribose-phosphate pyrophosphokinase
MPRSIRRGLKVLHNKLMVVGGTANPELAKKVADYLDLPLVEASMGKFPDGEISVKIDEDMRGTDTYVIQPTCTPVNDSLMELLIITDCLVRASASRVTAVIPYFGYARQDRKAEGRVPITAKLVANLITKAGTSRVLAIDLHAAQIQGFFDIPVDELWAAPVFVEHFQKNPIENLAVVSPDVGGIKLARAYSKRLGGELSIVDKRRISGEKTNAYHLIGDVKDKNVLITDDMIATGGSIADAARIVKDKGANDVYICATHAVFTPGAVEKLEACPAKEILVTDTIPRRDASPKVRSLTVATLIGEGIVRIHENRSVSSLFD